MLAAGTCCTRFWQSMVDTFWRLATFEAIRSVTLDEVEDPVLCVFTNRNPDEVNPRFCTIPRFHFFSAGKHGRGRCGRLVFHNGNVLGVSARLVARTLTLLWFALISGSCCCGKSWSKPCKAVNVKKTTTIKHLPPFSSCCRNKKDGIVDEEGDDFIVIILHPAGCRLSDRRCAWFAITLKGISPVKLSLVSTVINLAENSQQNLKSSESGHFSLTCKRCTIKWRISAFLDSNTYKLDVGPNDVESVLPLRRFLFSLRPLLSKWQTYVYLCSV